MVDSISAAQARRLALGAQGFAVPRPASVGTRQLNLLIQRLQLLQLDSVNVFERSHYLPVLARLGPYDKNLLDRLVFATRPPRRYLEFWAHAAAIVPVETLPLLRHRMDRYAAREDEWGRWAAERRPLLDGLLTELAARGPMTAGEIEGDDGPRRGPWWDWSDAKLGLEALFRTGEVMSAGRIRFERRYGLPEQVLPPETLAAAVPHADAIRELLRRGVVALGVATVADARDYFRLPYLAEAKVAMRELVESGEVVELRVEGWREPAYADPAARIPRRIDTVALLSPFDPVVWDRRRTLRVFDFEYRIEIYTPPARRRFGYYTLPLLVDDALVGRIDLKSDRQRGVLRVQSAWTEPAAPPALEQRVVPLLREIAAWQRLEGVQIAGWGDLAPRLAAEARVPLLPRGSGAV
ncbi:MAG: YcaQ family DNA glycosylase [Micrococcales bacterium]|nr:YcaQ family DNA glycosylase [Micrococcales bacterium]